MIRLCTDSSSLLPPSAAEDLGVAVAPIGVMLDGRSFEDGVDLDVDGFYARLEQGARATTSQPSPGRFTQLYEAAAASGRRMCFRSMSTRDSPARCVPPPSRPATRVSR